MTDDREDLRRARSIALTVLGEQTAPSAADLAQALDGAVAAATAMGDTVNREALRRLLETDVAIFQEDGVVLADDEDHRPWLDQRRGDIDWRFWRAYRAWSAKMLPPNVVNNLDRVTDDVLGRLEDPERDGSWDRRGMIVGQVQSGKTSNYTGLICKAADAGYKFIVVLAGLHNSLRSQTQYRLDEGFLGLDSRTSLAFANTNRVIGVGRGGVKGPPALTLTSSDEKGDFAKAVATRVAGRIGSDPVLLVVKKNKTILENLITWVTTSNGTFDPDTGRHVVSGFPLLVIDDEADNASVNTKKIEFETDDDGEILSETDPTAINRQIRRLLYAFRQSALVSYTATPFANIFIDEDERSPKYGEDLFPRSFILRMKPPSNYLGPAEVFGMSADSDPDNVGRAPLPVVRTVDDSDTWLEPGHKKDEVPGPLPGSLREAIRAFLLVAAAREARGQTGVHNSMLVHVTRFVAVQELVAEQIQAEVDAIKDLLLYGGASADATWEELEELWRSDFEKTTREMPRELRGRSVDFEQLRDAVKIAAGRIRVLQVNGSAGDALEYTDHPDGVTVIAVGGDKLSRGLTLEGLSVSYYLRASKMYDTLMQMGRWFGYRPEYADLIRLYTTGELQLWYREITGANEELGAKFDEMARVASNPRDFALYVRRSPAGLLVTAYAKMRHGRKLDISFSEDVSETISFRRDVDSQEANLDAVDSFLDDQTTARRRSATTKTGNPTWTGVPGLEVAAFLRSFRTHESATKAHSTLLAQYVEDRVRADELTDWTVALVNNTQAKADERIDLGGEQIGLTVRAKYPSDMPLDGTYAVRRLGSPSDELIDLDEQELDEALELTVAAFEEGESRASKRPRIPSGLSARRVRPATRGLLVIYALDPACGELEGKAIPGLMVSFPRSPGAPTVRFVMPRRYWEQEVG
jgi:hypothetical protein